ncbi:MAG TPA: hypothetical protein VKE98_18005 [Gemmataceae bacterium]|nr:hypothetical protein [Gemmataceae bacterium]
MHGTILVSGSLAQSARKGGLTWCFLQFLLGFRRLGYSVLLLDRLEPEMCVDGQGRGAPLEESINLAYFRKVMKSFGLEDRYSLSYNRGERTLGMSRGRVLEAAAEAVCLFNVMGYLNDEEILGRVRRRVFVDIDPGFGQMWRELGLHDPFAGHSDFVTLGCNIGRADCRIPTCGLKWLTLPQPVVLEHWPVQSGVRSQESGVRGQESGVRGQESGVSGQPTADCPLPFTSIGAWRGPNGPIEYQGKTYGLRVHEFRKFVKLPSLCPDTRFEMAFDIHPGDGKDIQLLGENGWCLVEPQAVAGSPESFRDYIAGSRAEFMVPKQMYVDTNSGLLSDRSVYYLASGRPVLARDTGIKHLYPTGDGLLTFTTLEEAVAGVEAINRDYDRHCRAARKIAETYFDSDKVLPRLLADLDVG